MQHLVRPRRPVLAAMLVAAVAALAGFPASRPADAGPPQPSPFPVRWELDFDAGPLRLYLDPAEQTAWWYFTYQITNRTQRDRVWAPDLVLYTDAGEILDSGDAVPTRITEAIRGLLGDELLETQSEIIGDLLQGPEHARDGLAVWPAGDLAVNELTLFVGGISGETARVRHPRTGQQFILRKTLQRDYLVPGAADTRLNQPIELVEERWVMR